MNLRKAISRLRPHPVSCIDPHERVLFFPTDAHLADNQWHIPVHGWIYRPTELSRLRRIALRLLKRPPCRLLTDPQIKSLFHARLVPSSPTTNAGTA